MSQIKTIKENIKAVLEQLERTEVLGEVIVDDFKKSIFNRDFSKFPVAILTTPTVESRADTNSQNLRTFTFEILFLVNAEQVTDITEVEELIENILNKFDNDVSLKGDNSTGAADGGVEPSSTTPEAIASGSKNYIAFSVIIRARAIRDLTFV
jgi:hypothetical protein